MKISILIISLLAVVQLNSQCNTVSFEVLKAQKNQMGATVYYLEGVLFTGITYDYYDQENVSVEHHLTSGLLTLKEGFRDGQKIEYADFKNGLLDGTYLKYFGDGQKYVEHHYRQGRMEGKQYGWKRDGSLRFVAEYKEGIPNADELSAARRLQWPDRKLAAFLAEATPKQMRANGAPNT